MRNTTALAMIDKKTNDVFHVMVCKDEEEARKYIDNDSKIEHKIIPDWDIVCEAVHRYNYENYYIH